ncbi:tachykinin-like peptides receptor 99D isoform X2 [Cherax quadricarinatus]|uniref:tachykinin-like peptides receptor 99D isoform X2 n=1 Tax=Cherax quadricarinatus TaxID=27406 RepID=UPI00387E90A0
MMMVNGEGHFPDDSSLHSHDQYQDATASQEREVLSNYSQVYATFVVCLVTESERLNLTLGEAFWLPILYDSFGIPHNTTTVVSHTSGYVSNGDQVDTTTVSLETTSSLSATPSFGTEYQWDYDHSSVQVIQGIIDHCSYLTPVTATPRPYLLVWWQQFLWTLVFGAMMAMAVGGNSLVMWIICAHRRMRTVTNYFLMNLSAADLFMSVLNCMFNFIYMLHSDWPFGAVYCTISNFMANVTISASVFTLMAISFDRYKDDEVRRGCILQWPDGQTSSSQHEHIYNIVFFITTYLLPMLVMLVCYYLIGRELWGSRSIGELTDRQVTSIRSKRRVVKMFIIIVTMFGLCWLPQQAFFLYTFHNSQILGTAYIQHIYLACYWLAMANAMINPVIYYWMNARFRSYFREVVMKCLCLKCPRRTSSYDGSPQLQRRYPPCDDPSSRSRSDSRQGVNGTLRTNPGSLRSNNPNHLVVYSSRERLNARNGVFGCASVGRRRGAGGGGSACNVYHHSLRPAFLNSTLAIPQMENNIQSVPLSSDPGNPQLDTHTETVPLTTVKPNIVSDHLNFRAANFLQSQL